MDPTTSRACGGRSSRSSTRACSSRTTGSRRTARAAAPALSDHELAQGYETVVDPSVYVRFPVTGGAAGRALRRRLLVWTTTPWTLVSNTAVAVHPDVDYVVGAATGDGERLRRRRGAARRGRSARTPTVLATLHRARPGATGRTSARSTCVDDPGRALRGARRLRHHRGRHRPRAPGAGVRRRRPRGRAAATACRWSTRSRPDGTSSRRRAAGRRRCSSRRPTTTLVADLQQRGLLFRHVPYEHTYPHCWRCHTPLLYYALPSWYIRTTAIKDRLLARERADQLVSRPRSSTGRYGDWLDNNIDWALSRNRYWGTPLPIWRCADEPPDRASGSLAELGELAGRDLSDLDPHRPYVDDVTFACPECGGHGHAGPRGHRRLVRLRRDAVRAVGLPARNGARSSRRPTRRTSSARRSTRPAAGSTR